MEVQSLSVPTKCEAPRPIPFREARKPSVVTFNYVPLNLRNTLGLSVGHHCGEQSTPNAAPAVGDDRRRKV